MVLNEDEIRDRVIIAKLLAISMRFVTPTEITVDDMGFIHTTLISKHTHNRQTVWMNPGNDLCLWVDVLVSKKNVETYRDKMFCLWSMGWSYVTIEEQDDPDLVVFCIGLGNREVAQDILEAVFDSSDVRSFTFREPNADGEFDAG